MSAKCEVRSVSAKCECSEFLECEKYPLVKDIPRKRYVNSFYVFEKPFDYAVDECVKYDLILNEFMSNAKHISYTAMAEFYEKMIIFT